MTDGQRLLDWSQGGAGIVSHRCSKCGYSFYFSRSFCPNCGSSEILAAQSAGIGVVTARTLLHRAPSEDLRRYAPYLIVLVRLDDGFTVMGHGDRDLAIGERVRARFIPFGVQANIPHFSVVGRQS